MIKSIALSLVLFAACTTDSPSTDSARRAIINTPCATSADCPTGFECEVEVEHGTTTSFCQADEPADDGSANGGCPAGYELEVEHGQNTCEPHNGSGSDDGSGSGSGSDDGSGSGSGSDDGSGHH